MTNEELIERLRQLELRITAGANETCRQAADAIERLTAQLAEARQAERAAVVAWLEGLHWTHANHKPALFFADAIKRGVHRAPA